MVKVLGHLHRINRINYPNGTWYHVPVVMRIGAVAAPATASVEAA
jgi:hypothetical protein